ncbi:MAG: 3'-5' exonuclease [Bacteroidota bacterium]
MNYIIFDLEATCWRDRGSGYQSEIIEIGALSINQAQQIQSEFSQFVRPQIHPLLSPFCTELTTITQEDVDTAADFPTVLQDFQDWIKQNGEPYLLCSWGFYDRKQLTKDCEYHGLATDWLASHISVKHQYAKLTHARRPMGMSAALKREKLQLEGTHHRGIDDARNIAKIFLQHFGRWEHGGD